MRQASGRSAKVTARALGISDFKLYERKRRATRHPRAARAPVLPESKESLQMEVMHLRQENLRLTELREI